VNILVVVGDAMARPLLNELDAHPARYDISSLVAVGSGGAVLSPSTKRRLAELLPGRIVADAFGSSETGQLGGRAPDDDPYGAPRLHTDELTDVLDDELRPVVPGSGTLGRLARSGHIPIGYLGDVEKTAATFVETGGKRWALPGDMATVDADGAIVVFGRGSLCINTGGEKVFPDEVEAAVKNCDDVEDVVVVGVPDERYGERVVAVVQASAGCRVDGEALRASCRGRLAGYKVPRQIVVTDAIRRSPAGKPDYRWAKAFALTAPVDGA
jgi:acyl-CoA synthetase (AMP-forming)/AMP-acid ligase II